MINNNCKKCGSDQYVKNGKVRSEQRYKCKVCGCNFISGDKREKLSSPARALAILLYGRGKASYGFIAKLFNVSSVAVMKLIKREADKMPDTEICSSINLCVITNMVYEKDKDGRPTCKVYWDETLTDTTPYYLSLPETQLRANDGTPLRNYPSVWTFTKFPEGWKVTNRSFDKDRAEEFKYGVNRVRRPAKPPYEHNSFRQRAGINPVW